MSLYNRVKVNTTTAGTGTVTLGASVDGYRSFTDASVANLDTVSYLIEDGSSWEIGQGVYTSGSSSLTRANFIASSSGSLLNLTGSATVSLTALDVDIATRGDITSSGLTANSAILLGRTTAGNGPVEEITVGFGLSLVEGNLTADGGSTAWTEIASATPTGVSSVDFTGLKSTAYNDLQVVFEGISHDNGTITSMNIAVSPDGSTFSSALRMTANAANTDKWWGTRDVPAFRLGVGCFGGGASDLPSSPSTSILSLALGFWRCTGGIDALRITMTAGNFDAGTIRLMGR